MEYGPRLKERLGSFPLHVNWASALPKILERTLIQYTNGNKKSPPLTHKKIKSLPAADRWYFACNSNASFSTIGALWYCSTEWSTFIVCINCSFDMFDMQLITWRFCKFANSCSVSWGSVPFWKMKNWMSKILKSRIWKKKNVKRKLTVWVDTLSVLWLLVSELGESDLHVWIPFGKKLMSKLELPVLILESLKSGEPLLRGITELLMRDRSNMSFELRTSSDWGLKLVRWNREQTIIILAHTSKHWNWISSFYLSAGTCKIRLKLI